MWIQQIECAASSAGVKTDERFSGPDQRDPDLIILFGPTETMRQGEPARTLARLYPDAIQIGCSSGTMVGDRSLTDEAVTGVLVGFDSTRLQLATRPLQGIEESRAVGAALGADLQADDLVGLFILSDGLKVNGSALAIGLRDVLSDDVVISGGLAADGARFSDTLVTIGDSAASGMVAAVGFYGDSIRFAHGSAGGWDEFGPTRKITRAEGSVLYELDGKPALELYERYLGDEAAGLPASGLLYPLKVWNAAHPEDDVVRTILAIDRDAGSLTFAGDVPEGWNARLMRGSFEHLVDGAAEAATHARAVMSAKGSSAQLCLLVSCVGRRLLMGQRTEDEIEAVSQVLGKETALAGFYSYGELAPHNRSGMCDLHNQTMTLTLISEAAR